MSSFFSTILSIFIAASVCSLWDVASASNNTSLRESCLSDRDSGGYHLATASNTESTSHVESYFGALGLCLDAPLINLLIRVSCEMSWSEINDRAALAEFKVPCLAPLWKRVDRKSNVLISVTSRGSWPLF